MCARKGKCACGWDVSLLHARFAEFALIELDLDHDWEILAAQLNVLFPEAAS